MAEITAVGALYDVIWDLWLPPFLEKEAIDEAIVRFVLMAVVKHLTHKQLVHHHYQVFPSDELLAHLVTRSPKQVGRVLDYLVRVNLLDQVRPAVRPGRGRPGRPPIYRVPIERWQDWARRPPRNGSDAGVRAIASTGVVETPASNGSDTGDHGSDTGVQDGPMARTPASTEPGQYREPGQENPASEPGHRASARDGLDRDGVVDGRNVALPGFAAAAIDELEEDGVGAFWQRVLDRLRLCYSAQAFDAYLRRTRPLGLEEATATLEVEMANPFHLDWLERGMANAIAKAVTDELGRPLRVKWVGPAPPAAQSNARPRPAPPRPPIAVGANLAQS